LVLTVIADGGAVTNKLVYEWRVGPRNQIELIAPIAFSERVPGDWTGGVGDLAFAFKRTVVANNNRGTIVSAAAELVVPTGSTERGLGSGTTVIEPFVALGQRLPARLFLQVQAGGALPFDVERTDLTALGHPRTKVMMNLANPEEAFSLSFIPNDGVGLARMEFIVSTYIKIHPLALVHFDQLSDAAAKAEIARMTAGYADRSQFFVDKLAQGVGMLAAAFYPKDVILRLSDFKTNEYANLIGGSAFEPHEDNPMIGFRGASRYYHPRYQAGFALECRAVAKVRDEMGLANLKLMIPFCRTVEEGRRVQAEMATHGLRRGENGLEIYVMCEIPNNVVLAEEFADIFDGFSIGSNDLTQLILGVDRDSEIVAPIFDERNPAVTRMIAQVIATCRAKGRKIGICGQAPSDYPEFAQFLVEQGIDSISLNPDTVLKTTLAILETETSLKAPVSGTPAPQHAMPREEAV
jgi:pyruvate,water dikinase